MSHIQIHHIYDARSCKMSNLNTGDLFKLPGSDSHIFYLRIDDPCRTAALKFPSLQVVPLSPTADVIPIDGKIEVNG